MPADKTTLALPDEVGHIAMVVKDMDKTTNFLSSLWGLGPWETFGYSPGEADLTVGTPFKLKFAQAKMGPTLMEVIQPQEGDCIWGNFLKTNGEGLHHIGFDIPTPNWDEMISGLKDQGCKMIVGGIFQGKRWCYFDINPGELVVEFVEA